MKHILVVEDEEHLAIGIKFNLEAEGYHVTTVGEGPTALQELEANPGEFDLIILDIMLPGMSGYTVCQTLREAGHDLPILILSARTLAEDRTRGFEVGADQYLMKPFELDELLSRVKNLLIRHKREAKAPPGEQNIYVFSNWTINYDTYQATRADGEVVRLTPTDLKLLRYFFDHAGRVVSRDELLEHVWGFSNMPTTRTVDNFVLKLRKEFEADPAQPRHFLSVRGAGYRFVQKPSEEEPA